MAQSLSKPIECEHCGLQIASKLLPEARTWMQSNHPDGAKYRCGRHWSGLSRKETTLGEILSDLPALNYCLQHSIWRCFTCRQEVIRKVSPLLDTHDASRDASHSA